MTGMRTRKTLKRNNDNNSDNKNGYGGKTLFVVGVGPGDPELITIKAVNAIIKSDFIFYPDVCGGRNKTAYDIIKTAIKFAGLSDIPENKLIPLKVEMKRSTGKNKDLYRGNALKIYEKLSENGCSYASYVTLGDPVFYSTYSGLYASLQKIIEAKDADNESININIINGVSSFLYSFGLIGEPYISKNASVLISVPVKKDLEEIKDEIKFVAKKSESYGPQLIVFMKAGGYVKDILKAFEELFPKETENENIKLYLIEKSVLVKDFMKKMDLNFDYFSILIGAFL